MDVANRSEDDQDPYNAELGILEPEENDVILNIDNWEDIMIEVTLDSGACRNIMPRQCAPGYSIQDSDQSRRGPGFIVGNGERVPNDGQFLLNLEADTGQGFRAPVSFLFQVADLIRPLMSVSQICEHRFDCIFKYTHALVVDQTGKTVCRFEKSGQSYTTKMTQKAPETFHRPS